MSTSTSKLTLNPANVFAPFRNAIGSQWDKVCNDARSQYGRWEKDFLKSKLSDWTVTDKGKLKSKEGHEIQMPLNSQIAILTRFGMQLNKLADNMGHLKLSEDGATILSTLPAPIPTVLNDWFEQMRSGKTPPIEEVATKAA